MAKAAKSVNTFEAKKVQGFLVEWKRIEAEASSAIGKIMKKAKDGKDNVLQNAEDVGIKRTVMRSVINEDKFIEKARGAREKFIEQVGDAEHADEIIHQRDSVAVAAGLTLFDYADETEKKKPEAKKAAPPKKGAAGTSPAKAAAKAAGKEEPKPSLKPMFEEGASGAKAKTVADIMDKAGGTPAT